MHGVSCVHWWEELPRSWPHYLSHVYTVSYVILISIVDSMEPRSLTSSTFSMLLTFPPPTALLPAHFLSVPQDHSLTTPFTKRSSFTLLKAPMRLPKKNSHS